MARLQKCRERNNLGNRNIASQIHGSASHCVCISSLRLTRAHRQALAHLQMQSSILSCPALSLYTFRTTPASTSLGNQPWYFLACLGAFWPSCLGVDTFDYGSKATFGCHCNARTVPLQARGRSPSGQCLGFHLRGVGRDDDMCVFWPAHTMAQAVRNIRSQLLEASFFKVQSSQIRETEVYLRLTPWFALIFRRPQPSHDANTGALGAGATQSSRLHYISSRSESVASRKVGIFSCPHHCSRCYF